LHLSFAGKSLLCGPNVTPARTARATSVNTWYFKAQIGKQTGWIEDQRRHEGSILVESL